MTPDWRTDAACIDYPEETFFPPSTTSGWGTARAICGDCPVRLACLEDALAMEGRRAGQSRFGMWGGLTPDERASLWRSRSRRGAAS